MGRYSFLIQINERRGNSFSVHGMKMRRDNDSRLRHNRTFRADPNCHPYDVVGRSQERKVSNFAQTRAKPCAELANTGGLLYPGLAQRHQRCEPAWVMNCPSYICNLPSAHSLDRGERYARDFFRIGIVVLGVCPVALTAFAFFI
ncbi:hypothetical protein [Bradyrhizobium sp. 6(2017)]|uniref:hypothetical protein n=1 Tax=Bradyrhizobium sp. 6(2017) TaxID=1197460 RepID=UPI0013E1CA56|nr:hypothetical protein [Bradyrhizobium sp. 6(2017)]QIG96809.1 hypothetical protein G6P99_33335 [Bradyrhizobium sp. 6(2017)]